MHSRDRDVDCVGACVGMKGMRVQSIIRELRGEKIDIIEYSDDPVVFATHALSPAKISRVTIVDPAEKHMEVIVDDSQLSLAIGKKGQNVRLAAKLLGWRIDIKSEEEKRQEVESQMAALVVPGAPVSVLIDHGLAEKVVEKLLEAGIGTVERLGSMTPEQLEEISGIGPKIVETHPGGGEQLLRAVRRGRPAGDGAGRGRAGALAAAPDQGAAAPGLEPATAAQEEGAAEPAAEAAAAAQEESAAAPGAEPAAPQVEAPKPEEAPESVHPNRTPPRTPNRFHWI